MSRVFVAALFSLGLVALVRAAGDAAPEKDPAHPWIGAWESTDRKENLENFVKAVDVSGGQAGPAGSQKVWHKFSKAEEGKFNHKIAAPDSSYKNEFNFKLNEEGSTTFNGSDIKFKYNEQGQELHVEYKVAALNKVVHDIYKVNGDELEKTYKVDDIVAKRWYKRTSSPPPASASAAKA